MLRATRTAVAASPRAGRWRLLLADLGRGTARWTGALVLVAICAAVLLTDVRATFEDGALSGPIQSVRLDPFWFTVPAALVLGAALLPLSRWGTARGGSLRLWCAVLFAAMLAQGLLWLWITRAQPVYDGHGLVEYGMGLARGDERVLVNRYLSDYPRQLGLVLYFQAVASVFGPSTPLACQVINCVLVATTGVLTVATARTLLDDRAARLLALLLACFPVLPMLAAFVYNDVPAGTLSAAAVLLCVRHLRRPRAWQLVAMPVLLGLAGVIRQNVLIFALAIAAVLLLRCLRTGRWVPALAAVAVVAAPQAAGSAVVAGFEARYHRDFGAGLPTMSWVSLGLHQGAPGPGWYQSENVAPYQEAMPDRDLAAERASADVRSRLAHLAGRPGEAAVFFGTKTASMWADSEFEAFRNTAQSPRLPDDRPAVAKAVTDPVWKLRLWHYLDAHASLVAVGLLAFLGLRLRRLREDRLLPLVALTGGFLFHTVWEAKARYVLSYWPMAMLLAAAGLVAAARRAQAWRRLRRAQGAGAAGSVGAAAARADSAA